MGLLDDINNIKYFNEIITIKSIKRTLKSCAKLARKEIRNRMREERRYAKVKIDDLVRCNKRDKI